MWPQCAEGQLTRRAWLEAQHRDRQHTRPRRSPPPPHDNEALGGKHSNRKTCLPTHHNCRYPPQLRHPSIGRRPPTSRARDGEQRWLCKLRPRASTNDGCQRESAPSDTEMSARALPERPVCNSRQGVPPCGRSPARPSRNVSSVLARPLCKGAGLVARQGAGLHMPTSAVLVAMHGGLHGPRQGGVHVLPLAP